MSRCSLINKLVGLRGWVVGVWLGWWLGWWVGGWSGGWVDGVVGGVVAGCCNAMVAWVVAHYQYVDVVLGG